MTLPEQSHVQPSERHIRAFLEEVMRSSPTWDGRWTNWSAADRARCVMALVQDHLHDHGRGKDWILAAQNAGFVLASLFHDRYPLHEPGKELPRLEIQMRSPEEGFAIQLRRVSTQGLPPIPVPGGAASVGARALSEGAESMARAGAVMDACALPDEVISEALDSIGEKIQDEGQITIMMVAAFIVRWKGAQTASLVRGGMVYRDIHNPAQPEGRRGDVRFSYERLGEHAEEAKRSVPDGGAYLLL